MNSDTPRTDAALVPFYDPFHPMDGYWVPADFARQLERELAEAKKERTYWEQSSFRAHQVCNEALSEMIAAGEKVAAQRDKWREVAEKLGGFLDVIRCGNPPQHGFGGEEFTEDVDDALETFRRLKEESK